MLGSCDVRYLLCVYCVIKDSRTSWHKHIFHFWEFLVHKTWIVRSGKLCQCLFLPWLSLSWLLLQSWYHNILWLTCFLLLCSWLRLSNIKAVFKPTLWRKPTATTQARLQIHLRLRLHLALLLPLPLVFLMTRTTRTISVSCNSARLTDIDNKTPR